MINTLRRSAALWASMAAILFAAATPAYSQAPTDAQRSAIRSQCRADYQAHCASVPPGGKASLQCLQQNMSSLSSGCQAAVRAVEAPAAPKAESAPVAPAESAPAAATAKPAAETAAPPPASNPPPAPKAAASTRGQKAEQCAGGRDTKRVPQRLSAKLRRRADRRRRGFELSGKEQGEPVGELSESRQRGRWRCGTGGRRCCGACGWWRSDGCNDRRPAAPRAPALVLRPMRPREVIFVLRSACGEDVRALCADVPAGGGRIIQCLATQAASLSPACANVLGQFATR